MYKKLTLPSTGFGVLLVVVGILLLPSFAQVKNTFSTTGFDPHGHCFLWKPEILRLYVISDMLIGLSYVAISGTLLIFVRRAKNVPFPRIFLAFGLFIVTCGLTHFLDIWTLWNPTYLFSGYTKFITAVASVGTALMLPSYIPKAMKLIREAQHYQDNQRQLRQTNRELQREIAERKQIEEQLRQSQFVYQNLINNLPDTAIIVFDKDMRYTIAEGPFLRDAGYDPVKMLGNVLKDTAPDVVYEQLRDLYQGVLEGETFDFIGRDAHDVFDYSARMTPMKDTQNEIIGGIIVTRNITKQKEYEREIKRSEALYRNLVNNLPDMALVVYDSDLYYTFSDGPLLPQINAKTELKDIVGKTVREVLPEAVYEDRLPYYQSALDGIPAKLETRVTFGDIIVDSHFIPIHGEDDNVTGGLIVMRDITQQKEYEREIKRSESLYRNLVNNLPDTAVMIFDRNMDYVLADGPLLSRMGFEQNEVIGKPLKEIASESLYEERYRQYQAVLNGETLSIETRATYGDAIVEAVFIPIQDDDDNVTDGLIVMRDITRQKQAEAQRLQYQQQLEAGNEALRESNEQLEQFAYVASHDLQEPLRMITSYLELVEHRYRDQLDDDARDFIGFAVDGAERMKDLIQDLLTYSRVTTAGKSFDMVNMNEVLEETLKNLEVLIKETKTEVTYSSLPHIKGDKIQLMQLLQNLINNAIKFHSEESPKLAITVKHKGDVDGWEFSVADNGIGIEEKFRYRIFHIFQRLHTREEYEGTGIGLALCKRIVERHGGGIWCDDNKPHGTILRFTLPIK